MNEMQTMSFFGDFVAVVLSFISYKYNVANSDN